MVEYNRGLMEEVQHILYYHPPPILCVLWPLLNMQKPAGLDMGFILFFSTEPSKTLLSQLSIVMRMTFLPPMPAFTSSLLMNPENPTLVACQFFHLQSESTPSFAQNNAGEFSDIGSND